MATIQIEPNAERVALSAASMAASELNKAIERRGQASWVLAGGRAPLAAYKVLAKDYSSKVDWSKVTVLLGDERCVPLGHPDSNWQQIEDSLLGSIKIPEDQQLRPDYEKAAEEAATLYAQVLGRLKTSDSPALQLDHLWLGIGEDGHTLSLFPGHPELREADNWVVAVHDSPKPPSDRISLTLPALTNVNSCLIQVIGSDKAEIIAKAINGDESLPIVQAINTIETNGGQVIWLLDQVAGEKL